MTEQEREQILHKAQQFNLPLSDFIIKCALGKKIVVATGIDEVVKQQKAIGRNLNQIATLANMDRLSVVNLQPVLEEHRRATELLSRILQEVN